MTRLLVTGTQREVAEMCYLWRRSHAIAGAKLTAAAPGFKETPCVAAIAEALAR